MDCTDRRQKSRFPLHVPCRFWWWSAQQGVTFQSGETLDISSGGVRIWSGSTPEVGSLLTIEIDLFMVRSPLTRDEPLEGPFANASRVLEGEGRVVWADTGEQQFAAQLCFSSMQADAIENHRIVREMAEAEFSTRWDRPN